MTTRLTDEELAELEHLERAATPGPWSAEVFGTLFASVCGSRRQVASFCGDAAMHDDAPYVSHGDYWCEVVPRLRDDKSRLSASSAVKTPTIAATYAALRALPNREGK